jgi:hypothetical protein
MCTSNYLFISILISLLVQWLTESRFGKRKSGIPFEKRSTGGSGYIAILAHVERVLYGTELGSVTLKINNQQSLMYAGIDRLASLLHKKIGDHYTIQLQYEPGSADLYVFGSPKTPKGTNF